MNTTASPSSPLPAGEKHAHLPLTQAPLPIRGAAGVLRSSAYGPALAFITELHQASGLFP